MMNEKPICPEYPNRSCCVLEPDEQIKYRCPLLEAEEDD